MKGYALILLCLIDVFPSCGKRHRPLPAAIGTTDKPRSVDVTVSNLGYTPKSVVGRPGEVLKLVFHYESSAGECGHELVVPQENIHLTLDEKKPAFVTLRVPQSGELTWSCGMNMLHGKIVVE